MDNITKFGDNKNIIYENLKFYIAFAIKIWMGLALITK